jgi:cytochrome b involved in lipid metabolism
MKCRALSSVLLAAVFLSAFSAPVHAATIAGTKCTKVGSTKTTGGVKYFCVKSGKKVIWSKTKVVKATPTPKATAVASKSPTPTKSATATASATPTASTSSDLIQLTVAEVKKHDSATSCWSIVYEKVFDLTKWISKHPGGAEKIRAICGKDGTSSFEKQHTGDGGATNQLANYFLGKLGESIKIGA